MRDHLWFIIFLSFILKNEENIETYAQMHNTYIGYLKVRASMNIITHFVSLLYHFGQLQPWHISNCILHATDFSNFRSSLPPWKTDDLCLFFVICRMCKIYKILMSWRSSLLKFEDINNYSIIIVTKKKVWYYESGQSKQNTY